MNDFIKIKDEQGSNFFNKTHIKWISNIYNKDTNTDIYLDPWRFDMEMLDDDIDNNQWTFCFKTKEEAEQMLLKIIGEKGYHSNRRNKIY